jgi:WD40 repeat protein
MLLLACQYYVKCSLYDAYHLDSAHTVLSSDGNTVYATNLDTGVEKYQLADMTRSLSMPYKVSGRIDTQLALANGDQWLVTGGEEGKARLWNTSTGQVIATLRHPSKNMLRIFDASLT